MEIYIYTYKRCMPVDKKKTKEVLTMTSKIHFRGKHLLTEPRLILKECGDCSMVLSFARMKHFDLAKLVLLRDFQDSWVM